MIIHSDFLRHSLGFRHCAFNTLDKHLPPPVVIPSEAKRSRGISDYFLDRNIQRCLAFARQDKQSLRFEHLDERLLRNIDLPDALHPFLSFLLFLQQLPLARNIAAVAFRGYIFSQRRNALTRNNFSANSRLNRHLIELSWDHFLEFGRQLASPRLRTIFVHNRRKRIDRLAINEEVQFYQFRGAIAGVLVIHRSVAARNTLNFVVKIDENFVQRQFAMQHHPTRIERLRALHLTALLQNQLQDVADIFIRAKHVRLYNRLTNFLDHARIRQVSGVIDQQSFSARDNHFIDDAWTRGDDVH